MSLKKRKTFNNAVVSDSLGSQDRFSRASHSIHSDPAGVLLQPVEFLSDLVHKLESADKHHRPWWDASFTQDVLDCQTKRQNICQNTAKGCQNIITVK